MTAHQRFFYMTLLVTGKLQLYGSVGVDQIFQRNDILRVGMNLDGAQDGYAKGTRGHNVSYTIPYGAHTFTLSYQRSKYHQTVESRPYDFISAGDTNISTFSWDYVLHRSSSMKTSMDLRLKKRNSHSFINDVEIPIQAIHQTSVEVGFSERLYLQRNTLYFRLAHRFGLGWLGAQKEKVLGNAPRFLLRQAAEAGQKDFAASLKSSDRLLLEPHVNPERFQMPHGFQEVYRGSGKS